MLVKCGFESFIGSSMAMQGVYRIIESAAPSTATVFITGESGTGKELCAEAVHQLSPRKEAPFIALNCAAIPKDLMESEIFGHVKGAFTGALSERQGASALADGGTLFLDELCEMDLDLQSKILRFIQSGTFQKVGSSKQEKVNVRFVCATNRDPLAEVREGRFREDLYYRLHVIPIALPPLRERGKDIVEIASQFLTVISKEETKNFKRFNKAAEQLMLSYSWPGNVRELENVVRNLVVLNSGEEVMPEMFPAPVNQVGAHLTAHLEAGKADDNQSFTESVAPQSGQLADVTQTETTQSSDNEFNIIPLAQVERTAIEQAINLCDGNIPKAAALLDVSPSTIYRKKQAWES